MPTTLITGCDTGIGREFASQYLREGWDVVATYLDPKTALPGHPRLRNLPLDVTDASAFEEIARQVGAEPIDLLISNAGIGLDTGKLKTLNFDYVRSMYEVNTLGPLRLVAALADNVAASRQRRIVAITSRMGAINLNLSGGHYGYRASKAGLNALMKSLAIDLFPQGVTVAIIHPGWVDTAGGGGDAALPVDESVNSMRRVISRLGNHETGIFLSYDGSPLPW